MPQSLQWRATLMGGVVATSSWGSQIGTVTPDLAFVCKPPALCFPQNQEKLVFLHSFEGMNW